MVYACSRFTIKTDMKGHATRGLRFDSAPVLWLRGNDVYSADIECDGGVYGVYHIPIGVPANLQGRRVKMEIGADVEYQQGKGETLRFRDGYVLRTDSHFGNRFHDTTRVFFILGGHFLHALLHSRTSFIFEFPSNVAEAVHTHLVGENITLQKPGDLTAATSF